MKSVVGRKVDLTFLYWLMKNLSNIPKNFCYFETGDKLNHPGQGKIYKENF